MENLKMNTEEQSGQAPKKEWVMPEIEALMLTNDPVIYDNDFVLNAGNDYMS